MNDETYCLKLLRKYEPGATPLPTDLVSAEFSVGNFRETFHKMTPEERNIMRERHFYRDPNVNTWVYCPMELSSKLPDSGVITKDSEPDSHKLSTSAEMIREEILEAAVEPFPLD